MLKRMIDFTEFGISAPLCRKKVKNLFYAQNIFKGQINENYIFEAERCRKKMVCN